MLQQCCCKHEGSLNKANKSNELIQNKKKIVSPRRKLRQILPHWERGYEPKDPLHVVVAIDNVRSSNQNRRSLFRKLSLLYLIDVLYLYNRMLTLLTLLSQSTGGSHRWRNKKVPIECVGLLERSRGSWESLSTVTCSTVVRGFGYLNSGRESTNYVVSAEQFEMVENLRQNAVEVKDRHPPSGHARTQAPRQP